MKDFFKKNDAYLFRVKVVLSVILVLITILFAILAIGSFVNRQVLTGILFIFSGIITIFVIDLVVKLVMSFLIDVKLIRNKLYEEEDGFSSNIDLMNFYHS